MSDTQHHVATVKAKAKAKWLKEVEKCLQKRFGITLNDCDSPEAFWVRWGDEGITEPDVAVKSYGEKYDLIDFGDQT